MGNIILGMVITNRIMLRRASPQEDTRASSFYKFHYPILEMTLCQNTKSVSYTHLDVYKRQVSKVIDIYEHYNGLFEQLENNAGQTILGIVGGEENVVGLFKFSDYNPVSYTHLTEPPWK